MMKRFGLLVLLGALAAGVPAPAQEGGSKPVVIPPVAYDTSPPLSQIVASAPREVPTGQRIIPLGRQPRPPGPAGPAEDPVQQKAPLPLHHINPHSHVAGIGADGVAPPDTNGSVGDTQYVQIVNVEYAVYDKAGHLLVGPTPIHNIWSGFAGDCASGDGGDPVVIYDKAANRWVVGQINVNYNAYCIAVSTTSDATGTYHRYEYSFGSNLPDYPKLGVWPDAYYFAANTFVNGSSFGGADPCAFDRATMLTGGAANTICLQQNTSVASLLPSDLDGSTAPPAGEPNTYLELYDTSNLGLFQFHVDFTTPANSTFTGPTLIPVAGYSEACGGGICIPQSGTRQKLDSLGDRLMYRLAYRNFGDHEAWVVNHSVTAGSSVGVRWYELRSTPPGSPAAVFQQGTFAPDSTYRWMGSIAMDQAGDIAVGYSASSSSIHPAIRYTGRVPSDPKGKMETETSIIEGTGSQTGGLNRWGDYSGMSIDPVDDCTFWYTNEYIPSNGSFNWNTQIAAFKFHGCGSPPPPDFTISASPASQTVTQGNPTSYTVTVSPLDGFNSAVTLSLTGCPANTACSFATNPIPGGSGSSTLNVTTTASTPTGTFTLTITGTSGVLVHSTMVTLVVNSSSPPPDFLITASPTSLTVLRGSSKTATINLAALNGFGATVNLSVSGSAPRTSAGLSPTSVNTFPGSSTLTVTVNRKAASGTKFTLTITGTSGALMHATTVTVTVP